MLYQANRTNGRCGDKFAASWIFVYWFTPHRMILSDRNSVARKCWQKNWWNLMCVLFAIALINYIPQSLTPFAILYLKMLSQKEKKHTRTKKWKRICWVGICMRPIIVVKRFHDIHRRIELMSSVCYFLSQPKIPISLDGDEMNFRLY